MFSGVSATMVCSGGAAASAARFPEDMRRPTPFTREIYVVGTTLLQQFYNSRPDVVTLCVLYHLGIANGYDTIGFSKLIKNSGDGKLLPRF